MSESGDRKKLFRRLRLAEEGFGDTCRINSVMSSGNVDCSDLLAFQDALGKLRVIDDKILFELNCALPSNSFSANVDKGEKCRQIYQKLINIREQRLKLIQRCVDLNQENVARLRKSDVSSGELRLAQNTLRLIKSEMDVENIVNERSEKAVHDRCRTFL